MSKIGTVFCYSSSMSSKGIAHKMMISLGKSGLEQVRVHATTARAALRRYLSDNNIACTTSEAELLYRYLKSQNLVLFSRGDAGFELGLSPYGAQQLLGLQLDSLAIPPMPKWDCLWRLVSYDIPNIKTTERREFSARLLELGFVMVQRSMWVHPYECFDQIKLVTDHLNITRHVAVMEIHRFDTHTTKRLTSAFAKLLS